MNNDNFTLKEIITSLKPPILIVSSFVGRGNYSIGEAFKQQCGEDIVCHHVAIEELLPSSAVEEDLQRYKWISNNLRLLLYLIYCIPIFYHIKHIREKWFSKTDLSALEEKIHALGINSVISVSHRPSFWVSLLKERSKLNFGIWGVLTEFGTNLGWRYISWVTMNGFLSIIPQEQLSLNFPSNVVFKDLEFPCRQEFFDIAGSNADKNNLIFVAGYWGQVNALKAIILLRSLLKEITSLNVYVVCGTNEKLAKEMKEAFEQNLNVKILGAVNSLLDLMKTSCSIITKPGFSTIIEAHAASKKIFLLKGMPVAEDHNANYAIFNFSAEWYSIENFKKWYDAF